MRERGVKRVGGRTAGEHGAWGPEMWGDIGVGDECCGDGGEGNEEVGAEVCAQTGDEPGRCGQGDFFFDVEVETGEVVDGNDGVEGGVVCLELGVVS